MAAPENGPASPPSSLDERNCSQDQLIQQQPPRVNKKRRVEDVEMEDVEKVEDVEIVEDVEKVEDFEKFVNQFNKRLNRFT